MQYLVDGHNLIPKLGMSLDSLDDEQDLIRQLNQFCRLERAQVEVHFDGAPPGQAGVRTVGLVSAHFIRKGSSADSAIERRLGQLKKAAKNWTVVSSDRRLERAAQESGARVVSSEDFSSLMAAALAREEKQAGKDTELSAQEVEHWMELFAKRRKR
jgi:predicted RNA-binding protein with PIN domain